MHRRPTIPRILVILSPLAMATAALAHVTLETAEAPANSSYKAVLRVPHGCAGQATHTVRVQIPEGFIAVKPMPKPGWKLETRKGPYAKTYDYFGSKLSEGVKEVIWSGGELLDEHYDEFVLRGRIADLPPGSVLWFKTVQECANGAERWIEIPAENQKASDLKYPAPSLKVIEKKSHDH
jgi:uncharacterized protein YcnI